MTRSPRLVAFAVFALALGSAVGLGLWTRSRRAPTPVPAPVGGLECGQWAVLRTCELMGVPVSFRLLRTRMPAGPRGHSLQDIATVLQESGLKTDGVHESFDSFLGNTGVRVVHVADPDHFIVVTRAGPDLVFFLDHEGRRQVVASNKLRKRWSGSVLYVEKPADARLLGFDRAEPADGKPRVQFDALFIDKGDVLAGTDADRVRFEFPFANLGKGDLSIARVRTSCGCLAAHKPDAPVKPGQKGTIVLEYSVNKERQSFSHEAAVETNDPATPVVVLRAAGHSNVLVSVHPPALALGDVPVGAEHRAFFVVKFNGEEGFAVRAATPGRALAVAVHTRPPAEIAERLWPGGAGNELGDGVRVVEVRLTPGRVAALDEEVFVSTDVKGFEKVRVPVTGRAVPPVSAAPSLLSFGEVSDGESLGRTLLLSSSVGAPFRVVSVGPDVAGFSWSAEPMPDGRVRLRFVATGRAAVGLSGSKATVRLESGGAAFDLDVPVFALRRTP